MIIANVGDIWRFVEPNYRRNAGRVSHYLILDQTENKRYGYLYLAMELERGIIVEDLLIDAANIQNYRAEKVE